MTLSEICPHNRSSIDPMQMVMLCRKEDFKFFGQQVFTPLLSDLKDMEEFGIVLKNGETVRETMIMPSLEITWVRIASAVSLRISVRVHISVITVL